MRNLDSILFVYDKEAAAAVGMMELEEASKDDDIAALRLRGLELALSSSAATFLPNKVV
jgi:hypothetical protein